MRPTPTVRSSLGLMVRCSCGLDAPALATATHGMRAAEVYDRARLERRYCRGSVASLWRGPGAGDPWRSRGPACRAACNRHQIGTGTGVRAVAEVTTRGSC